jgi:hypothetical protein
MFPLHLFDDNSFDEIVAINDMFVGNSPISKSDDMPAILTNFDTEEMSYIYNFINNR